MKDRFQVIGTGKEDFRYKEGTRKVLGISKYHGYFSDVQPR